MQHSEKTPSFEHYLIGDKTQESACERILGIDIILNLELEYHIRKIKEVNYLFIDKKIVYKYLCKEMLKKYL